MLAHTEVLGPEQTGSSDADWDASFKAAFHSLRIPVLMLGPQGPEHCIVFANDAFHRLSGYAESEILDRGWRLIADERADRQALDAMDASLSAGEGYDGEFLCRSRNGSPYWGALTVSPIHDDAGRVRLFTVMLNDVSARKQVERLLEEQVERKTALLHEVEHRVKNSLQMTASLVLLKARRLPSPEARSVLHEVAERVGALAAAHRVLHVSGDAGRFDIRDFTTELAGELILGLPKDQVEVILDVQPLAVPASKAAALALLLNEAVANAVKHAFPDGRRGRLTVAIARAGNGLTIAVEDDGVGLDHVPAPEGSFGKTLMTMLAHQLKGRLTWRDMGPGTRVEIELPIDAEEAQFE